VQSGVKLVSAISNPKRKYPHIKNLTCLIFYIFQRIWYQRDGTFLRQWKYLIILISIENLLACWQYEFPAIGVDISEQAKRIPKSFKNN